MDALARLHAFTQVPKWIQEALSYGMAINPDEIPSDLRDRIKTILPPSQRYMSYTNSATVVLDSQGAEIRMPMLKFLGMIAFPDADPIKANFVWRDRNWRNASISNIKMEAPKVAPQPNAPDDRPWRERNRDKMREYQRRYQAKKRLIARMIGEGGTPEQKFEGDDQSEFDKLIAELQAPSARREVRPEADPLDSPLSSLHAERATRDEAPIE